MKSDYEKDENNEVNEKIVPFRTFRYLRLFRNRSSKSDMSELCQRALLITIMMLALIGIGLIINAQSVRDMGYEIANDFPRGALVYAQFNDLPALLKQWGESSLKDRYLHGTSFQQLKTRHLAQKLVSRWEEYNEATGFPIDSRVLGSLADNRAAIALYDIGRLNLVMISPLSEKNFAATMFFRGKDEFDERASPDGTIYYLHDVEADKGRQKQVIGFSNVKGRFLLATDEQLLLRTIANLKGQSGKDRLFAEPSFRDLSRMVAPHAVTVWVDQAKLNEDWYFRHYWIQRNLAELKGLRAAIFDLEFLDKKWVERREFMRTDHAVSERQVIPKSSLQRVTQIVPKDIPFIQVRALDSKTDDVVSMAREALFASRIDRSKKEQPRQYHYSGDEAMGEGDDGYYGYSRYSSLSHNYDLIVDDPEEADVSSESNDERLRLIGEHKFASLMNDALRSARPLMIVKIANPNMLDGPLFAEFRRAVIISLQNPSSLDRRAIERAIGELASSGFLIAGSHGGFEWIDRKSSDGDWREMKLPALGRSVGYGLRGHELIIANQPEMLASLMGKGKGEGLQALSPIHEVTVIRLSRRREVFDSIFTKLDEPRIKSYWKTRRGETVAVKPSEPSQEFFSGNIASLLDAASPVEEIRIERSFTVGMLREEVTMILH